MTITVSDGVIRLSGATAAEDSEVLLQLLAGGADRVDLSDCQHLHAAVLQLLMASRPAIVGAPAPFLREWIVPVVTNAMPPLDSARL